MGQDTPNTTKPQQGNNAQPEDPQIAMKAEERRRRLANMIMDDERKPPEQDMKAAARSQLQQLSTPPGATAVFASTNGGYTKTPASTTMDQKPVDATAPTNVPLSLTDLEVKATARQGHVSRLLSMEEQKATTASTNVPSSLADLEIKASARQGHVSRLLGMEEQKSTTAPTNVPPSLTDLEIKASARQKHISRLLSMEEQKLHNKIADSKSNTPDVSHHESSQPTDQSGAARISEPSTIPTDPASPRELDPEEGGYGAAGIQGRLVFDDDEAILEDARRDIISRAVVAEVREVEPTRKVLSSYQRFGILFLVLLLVGIIAASICGSGNCSSAASVQQQAPLSKEEIVEIINAARVASSHYNNATIDYPVIDRETLTPEEAALKYMVESTAPSNDARRIVQRYALCVFWFTNMNVAQESQDERPAFARSTDDECSWRGVVCDANQRVMEINVKNTNMAGTLPDDAFGLLTDLTVLNLAKNSFSGELPTALTAVSRLEILDISENAFGGSVFPAYLDHLQLIEFKASKNRFQGSIPAYLGNQTLLNTLHIGDNAGFRETIPSSLGALTALTSFHFGGPVGTGAIPGSLPAFLQTLTNLRHLEVGEMALDDDTNQDMSLYTGLTKLTSLTVSLVLTMDQTIPSILGEAWPDMEQFLLLGNNIVGTLPPSLTQWTSLRAFAVSWNGITGSIPPEYFRSWPNLELFDVWLNKITGSLPSSIGGWSQLQSLGVGSNQLTGTIPTELGLLTNMHTMLLNSNRFTGTIPSEMANLSVTEKWLHQNNFTGPSPFCQNGQTTSTTRVDCEKVVCPCCENCLGNE